MALGGGTSVLALVLALAPAAASAGDARLVPIVFEAPADCSSADAFYAGVLARTDRARLAHAGQGGVRVSVRLTRTPTTVHGELRITDARGASETRKVDGASCDEVVEVLSLTTALALDPAAGAPPPSPAPVAAAPPAPPPAVPRTAPPAAVPHAPPPVVRAPPPPPAPVAAPWPAPPPPPPVSAPPPPTVAADEVPIVVPAAPPAPARPGPFALELGAAAAAAGIVSPTVSLGGALVLRVARRTGAAVEPSLGLTLGYLPNDFLQPPSEVVVRWTALSLVACPGWGFRRTVVVQACALGAGGWLSANDRLVNRPQSAGRTWWAAGALARAALPLGGGLALELDAGFGVPLVKRRFVTTTPDRTVAETPAVSPLLGLGLAYRL